LVEVRRVRSGVDSDCLALF